MSDITYSAADLIERYIQLRDEKARLNAELEVKLKPVTESMDAIEQALLVIMQEQGDLTSMKTGAGMAIRSVKTRYDLVDRGAFLDFIRTTGQVEFMETRVAQKAVAEALEEGKDIPPGVNAASRFSITVRRG